MPKYEKGRNYNYSNYRPISLNYICCKLLEYTVDSSIMTHAGTHNIPYPLPHGFRKFRSCETQFLEFINYVSKNPDDGKHRYTFMVKLAAIH